LIENSTKIIDYNFIQELNKKFPTIHEDFIIKITNHNNKIKYKFRLDQDFYDYVQTLYSVYLMENLKILDYDEIYIKYYNDFERKRRRCFVDF